MNDRCMACGQDALRDRVADLRIEHAGQSRVIQDAHSFCQACGNVSYVGPQVSAHERAVAAAIREIDGLLSPEDLFEIRSKYRLKQTDMEQMLSTGPKTWTRWERGKVPQGKAADKLIRLMADDPAIAQRLMKAAGVNNPDAEAVFEQFHEATRAMRRSRLSKEFEGTAIEVDRVIRTFDEVDQERRRAAAHMDLA